MDKDGKMVGSGMVLRADSEEAAWAVINADWYSKENVWDKEKIIVKPFAVNELPKAQAKL